MLSMLNALLAWLHAHPREAFALLLLLGWVANWAAGSVDAALRGSFSFQEWPRILRSQLASTEALAVYAIYGIAFLAVVAQAAASAYKAGHLDQATVNFIGDQLLNLASAAAAVYAMAVWHEVLRKQLPDIVSAVKARLAGTPGAAVKRNLQKLPSTGAIPT